MFLYRCQKREFFIAINNRWRWWGYYAFTENMRRKKARIRFTNSERPVIGRDWWFTIKVTFQTSHWKSKKWIESSRLRRCNLGTSKSRGTIRQELNLLEEFKQFISRNEECWIGWKRAFLFMVLVSDTTALRITLKR